MSRRTRLVVLLASSLLLVIAIIVVVPYRIEEEHINRRTGDISRVTVIALISRSEPDVRSQDDLSELGALTAPDEWLLVSKHVYPFPWSHVSMSGHWLAESRLEHWCLKVIRHAAFRGARECRPLANLPIMSDQEFSALMTRRLALWNSLTIDRTLESVQNAILLENERLFPGSVKGVVDTVTITTTSSK
jgi:hypothetical protein